MEDFKQDPGVYSYLCRQVYSHLCFPFWNTNLKEKELTNIQTEVVHRRGGAQPNRTLAHRPFLREVTHITREPQMSSLWKLPG